MIWSDFIHGTELFIVIILYIPNYMIFQYVPKFHPLFL